MKNIDKGTLFFIIWRLGSIPTLIYLMFFDGTNYNWWNWIIIVPLNFFLAEIWPIYWMLHWLFGL